jgi:CHASE2 domain-containing sensor protein
MVTETGNRIMSRNPTAQRRQSNAIGMTSIGFAVVSLVMLFVAGTRSAAWLPAVPAVIVAAIALSTGLGR